jgi:predicted ribosomally synthesized peptide with SipW-like signal peptide
MNQLTILLTTLSFSSVTASHPAVRGAKTNGEPRRLQQVVSGECTVANFSDEMLVVGGQPTLASWLDVENVATTIQAKLDVLCAEALKPTM